MIFITVDPFYKLVLERPIFFLYNYSPSPVALFRPYKD